MSVFPQFVSERQPTQNPSVVLQYGALLPASQSPSLAHEGTHVSFVVLHVWFVSQLPVVRHSTQR